MIPFDPIRIHLFGYSQGGMLAHRLAHEDPNRYASMWVQSASIGGQAHDGGASNIYGPPVVFPPTTIYSMSYFHHHGQLDESVVPGGGESDPPNASLESQADFDGPGGLSTAQALKYRRTDYPAMRAVSEYYYHNGAGYSTVHTNQPDRNGGTASTHTIWSPPGGPNSNPTVHYYLDPTMDHTNFTNASSNRYFQATNVWSWFESHWRVSL